MDIAGHRLLRTKARALLANRAAHVLSQMNPIAPKSGIPKAVVPIKLKVHHARQEMTAAATTRAVENPRMISLSVARDAASPKYSRYCICSTMLPLNWTATSSEPIKSSSASQDQRPGLDHWMAWEVIPLRLWASMAYVPPTNRLRIFRSVCQTDEGPHTG